MTLNVNREIVLQKLHVHKCFSLHHLKITKSQNIIFLRSSKKVSIFFYNINHNTSQHFPRYIKVSPKITEPIHHLRDKKFDPLYRKYTRYIKKSTQNQSPSLYPFKT